MGYSERLEGGKFNLDNVLRVCDLMFKKNGQVLKSRFSQAHEMLAILGDVASAQREEKYDHSTGPQFQICVWCKQWGSCTKRCRKEIAHDLCSHGWRDPNVQGRECGIVM